MSSSFKTFLSQQQFDCLSFSNVGTLTTEEKAAVGESMVCALTEMLKRMDVSADICPVNNELRQRLYWWAAKALDPLCAGEDRLLALLAECATAVEEWYPLASTEAQIWYAKGLAIGRCADDSVSIAPGGLSGFSGQMWAKDAAYLGQGSKSLSSVFVDFINGFRKHFATNDPLVGLLGASSWLDFGIACSLERNVECGNVPHISCLSNGDQDLAKSYLDGLPKTMRRLSGLGGSMMVTLFNPTADSAVPLRYWVTILDYADTYVGLLNDLVSLPKEILAGETANYFALQTRARREAALPTAFPTDTAKELWTFRDTVCETMDKVYDATLKMDEALIRFSEQCPEPERTQCNVDLASQLWKLFRDGYARWHMRSKRYGLESIGRNLGSPSWSNKCQLDGQSPTLDKPKTSDAPAVVHIERSVAQV